MSRQEKFNQHLTIEQILQLLQRLNYPREDIIATVDKGDFIGAEINDAESLSLALDKSLEGLDARKRKVILFKVTSQGRDFQEPINQRNHYVALSVSCGERGLKVIYIDPTGKKISPEVESVVKSGRVSAEAQIENATLSLQYSAETLYGEVYQMNGNDYDCGVFVALASDFIRHGIDHNLPIKLDEKASKKLGISLRMLMDEQVEMKDIAEEIQDTINRFSQLEPQRPKIAAEIDGDSSESRLPRPSQKREKLQSEEKFDWKKNDEKILSDVISLIDKINAGNLGDIDFVELLTAISEKIAELYKKESEPASVRNRFGHINYSTKTRNELGINFDAIASIAMSYNYSDEGKGQLERLCKKYRPNISQELQELREKFIATRENQEDSKKIDIGNIEKIGNLCRAKNSINYLRKVLEDENLHKDLKDPKQRSTRYVLARTLVIIGEIFKKLPNFEDPNQIGAAFETISKIRDQFAHHHSLLRESSDEINEKLSQANLPEIFAKIHAMIVVIEEKFSSQSQMDNLSLELDATQKAIFEECKESINKIKDIYRPKKEPAKQEKSVKKDAAPKEKKEAKNPLRILETIKLKAQELEEMKDDPKSKGKKAPLEKAIKGLVKLYNEHGQIKDSAYQVTDLRDEVLDKIIAQLKLDDSIAKPEIAKAEVLPEDSREKEKKVEKVKGIIFNIKEEVEFLKECLKENKGSYVIEHCETVIGGLLSDLEAIDEDFLQKHTPSKFRDSKVRTTSTRNRLDHEILNRHHINLSDVIYRDTLPMLPEIGALEIVLEYICGENAQENANLLNALGRAYIVLEKFDEAKECFEKMIFLRQDSLSPEELATSQIDFLNGLRGLAENEKSRGEYYSKKGDDKKFREAFLRKIEIHHLYNDIAQELDFVNPMALASNFNNMASAYGTISNHGNASKYHQKAFAILRGAQNEDQEKEALYLANSAISSFIYLSGKLKDVGNQDEALSVMQQFQPVAASLWQAIKIFESLKKDSEIYIKTIGYCCLALTNIPEYENFLYAKELYKKLEDIFKTFPARRVSTEFSLFTRIKEIFDERDSDIKKAPKSSGIELAERKFKTAKELFDAEFEIKMLSYLITFFQKLDIHDDLSSQLSEARSKVKKYQPSFDGDKKAKFFSEILSINEAAMNDFNLGNMPRAIVGFKVALARLEESEYAEFHLQFKPLLLCSIGETLLRDDSKKEEALKYFCTSFDEYLKDDELDKDDRDFYVFKKILELSCQLHPGDHYGRLAVLEKAVIKFKKATSEEGVLQFSGMCKSLAFSYLKFGKVREAVLLREEFGDRISFSDINDIQDRAAPLLQYPFESYHEYLVPSGDVGLIEDVLRSVHLNESCMQFKDVEGKRFASLILPSEVLKKDLRERLGVERKRIFDLNEDQKKSLKEKFKDLTIEKDPENAGKMLITYSKGEAEDIQKFLDQIFAEKPSAIAQASAARLVDSSKVKKEGDLSAARFG